MDLAKDRITVVQMSTRPMTLTTGEKYVIDRAALDGAAEFINGNFVPAHWEHLAFLPPLARWGEAKVVEASDGHFELQMTSEPLEASDTDDDPLSRTAAVLGAAPGQIEAEVAVLTEPRNFEPHEWELIQAEAPLPLSPEHRWAALPPLEWVITVGVVWAAVKFGGGFLEELGRGTAKATAEWIRGLFKKAKEPSRDKVLTIRFDLPGNRYITGHVIVRHDDSAPARTMETALNAGSRLAEFAGAQQDDAIIPGMARAAFLWDGTRWRLAWYATGEGKVYISRWLRDNPPDVGSILGRLIPGVPGENVRGVSGGFQAESE